MPLERRNDDKLLPFLQMKSPSGITVLETRRLLFLKEIFLVDDYAVSSND